MYTHTMCVCEQSEQVQPYCHSYSQLVVGGLNIPRGIASYIHSYSYYYSYLTTHRTIQTHNVYT